MSNLNFVQIILNNYGEHVHHTLFGSVLIAIIG